MPTKAEIQAELEEMKSQLEEHRHNERRLHRALNQASLDLAALPERMVHWPTPHIDPRSAEALARGNAEWEMVVKDPSQRINTYIRTRAGIGWGWEKEYVKNGQYAWCGAFAAFCWTAVKFSIRQKLFPSCWRLYNSWSQTSRRIEVDQMAPGDIVVVYAAAKATWGDHITICEEAPSCDGVFKTIEGNAHGTLGDGSYGEGVIKRERNIDQVAHVYRLLGEDFDE